MRRLSLLCAAAGLAVSALAVTSPAEAAYDIIRWDNTGFCQLWDDTLKVPPPAGTKLLTKKPIVSLTDAFTARSQLVTAKTCTL